MKNHLLLRKQNEGNQISDIAGDKISRPLGSFQDCQSPDAKLSTTLTLTPSLASLLAGVSLNPAPPVTTLYTLAMVWFRPDRDACHHTCFVHGTLQFTMKSRFSMEKKACSASCFGHGTLHLLACSAYCQSVCTELQER